MKEYRSLTHQSELFELKMVAASVVLLQERKSCHLFLFFHFCYNGYGSISYFNLLKSTSSFLEFYTVRLSFDVFFRGYIAEVEG